MWLGDRSIGDALPFAFQANDTGGSASNGANMSYQVVDLDTGAVVAGPAAMAQIAAITGLYGATITLTDPPYTEGHDYSIRGTGTVDGETPAAVYSFRIAPSVGDQVWDEPKADHQGETIMGNIAEDTDNLQVTAEEG